MFHFSPLLNALSQVKSFPSRLEAAAGSKEVAVDVLLNNAGVTY
jgi:hypothetical protein